MCTRWWCISLLQYVLDVNKMNAYFTFIILMSPKVIFLRDFTCFDRVLNVTCSNHSKSIFQNQFQTLPPRCYIHTSKYTSIFHTEYLFFCLDKTQTIPKFSCVYSIPRLFSTFCGVYNAGTKLLFMNYEAVHLYTGRFILITILLFFNSKISKNRQFMNMYNIIICDKFLQYLVLKFGLE